jgi:hypothetical protein
LEGLIKVDSIEIRKDWGANKEKKMDWGTSKGVKMYWGAIIITSNHHQKNSNRIVILGYRI